jgi:aminoglycoside phosphotransferase (APT) family kinase protein
VFLLCEDPSVIGGTFFLMEHRHGLVIRDAVPGELAVIPDYPRRVSEAFIDALVRLHSIDVSQPALSALGKPQGFVERQVRGWAERWNRAKTEEAPDMDRIVRWLHDALPPSVDVTLVHNDYKLDNVMLRPDGSRVQAVLDWEMATIGDPLADLGLTMCYWTWASVAAEDDPHPATPNVTTQAGWYTRDQFLQRYAERTGRDLTHIRYHEILGIFKLAVILQQIYYRFHQGQTRDERFRTFDQRVRGLIRLAASLVEKESTA